MSTDFQHKILPALADAFRQTKAVLYDIAEWTTRIPWKRFLLLLLMLKIIGEFTEDALFLVGRSEGFHGLVNLCLISLLATKIFMGSTVQAREDAVRAGEEAQRESLRRQASEARMQMMQAQVEPHFLFNTLASVEHLIETDPPRAAAMQRRLIQYLRAVLPQLRESVAATDLGREAGIVSSYLELLKMRMEERLRVEVNIPEGLRSAAFPALMLQPLVENAIKHGIEPKPEGGTVRISAEVAHNRLLVKVEDDGLGFGAVKSDGTGFGLKSIRERLSLLYGDRAQLVISPNTPCGVKTVIELPYSLAQAEKDA